MKTLGKSDIKIGEWEFEFQQRNKNCILMADLHSRGLYFNLPGELKLNVPRYDYVFTSSYKGYVKRAQKKEVLEKIRAAISDDNYLAYVIKSSISKMEDFGRLTEKAEREMEDLKISNERVAELWQSIDDGYRIMMPWFYIPWYISEYNMLTDRVKLGLEVHKDDVESITDLSDALLTLTFPVKKATFQEEQAAFFELVDISQGLKNFESSPTFQKKADIYLKAYGWMRTFFFLPIPVLSKTELVSKIKEAVASSAKSDFEAQQNARNKNKERADKLLKIISNDARLRKDVEWARELGWVLTASVEAGTRGGARLPNILNVVALRVGIDKEDMIDLTSAEITSALHGKMTVNSKELKNRKDGYVLAHIAGESMLESGSEGKAVSEWIDEEIGKVKNSITEFKGQPASRGIAKGKVRIALTPQDSYLLEEGEILVCSMTAPDYVPAMKRAAAIVTVEGGLLSHAAIMSREFGKPCVIGTKIATKVLKDGDMVEVDAEKGVVTILKKASEK